MSGIKKRGKDEEDVVSAAIGEFGRWQLLMTFLLSLFNIPCTWHIFAPTFHAAERDVWCARTEGFMDLTPQKWKNYTQPGGYCTMYDVRNATLDNIKNLKYTNPPLLPCTDWEFAGEGKIKILLKYRELATNNHFFYFFLVRYRHNI